MGDITADESAQEKPEGDDDGDPQVGVSVAVIFPKPQQPDGQKQCAERCPLSLVLLHLHQVDQRRDNDDSATDPEETADEPTGEPYRESQENFAETQRQLTPFRNFFAQSMSQKRSLWRLRSDFKH